MFDYADKESASERSRTRIVHVVDDDDAVRDSVRVLLESHGLQVRDYPSARSFLDADANHGAGDGCLLLDLHMPGMTGLELLDRLGEEGSVLPVIVMTGRSDSTLKERALRSGAVALLDKPVAEDVLLSSIARGFAASGHR